MPEKTIGQVIKKYRLIKSLSQSDLAVIFNLNRSTIRYYENDMLKEKTDALMLIHDAIDYSLNKKMLYIKEEKI